MKLDILVLASHPDDAELCCGGTIATHTQGGFKVGIIDFTQGELGTRGTPEIRQKEASEAAKILNVSVRENLKMKDGFFKNDEDHQRQIIEKIRQYQPEIVLTNAPSDRHPDHGRGAHLASDACFLSGLTKIESSLNGTKQEAWRPKAVYHFIQNNYLEPDFIVDVSSVWEEKIKALKAFESQFLNKSNDQPQTILSKPEFFDFVYGRGRELGHIIGVMYGEGFITERKPGVKTLKDIF